MGTLTSKQLEREASRILALHGFTREARPHDWAPPTDAMAHIVSHDWNLDAIPDEAA